VKRLALILLVAGVIALAGGTALAQRASGQSISGTADNLTAGSLVIQGKTVLIDENTIVEGSLIPGATVVIKTDQVNGVLHAARIVIKEPKSDPKRKHVQIDGKITAVSANNEFVVRGKNIATDNNTRIDGELVVGSEVEVKAQMQGDGLLLAVEVEVEEGDDDDDDDGWSEHRDGDRDDDEGDDGDEGDDRDDDDDRSLTSYQKAAPDVVPAAPPAGSTLNGQQLFRANCTGCHGVPSTNRTQARLISFISGHNTGKALAPEQVAAIAAWLKP
jgi:hypothetical protein